jgi:transcriptional regulator with XRE-family HTH domain
VNLGRRLREVRIRAGLSLRELARRLAVSPAFVSQLENGKSQPSVATLYTISQVLNVSIDELFAPDSDLSAGAGASGLSGTGSARNDDDVAGAAAAPGGDRRPSIDTAVSRTDLASPADAWPTGDLLPALSVTHPGSRPRLVMDTGVVWEQLAANTDHTLDFIEIIYPAGSSSTNDSRMLRHSGHEFGILLDGELEVTYGFDVFTLHAGDAMGLDSAIPHLFRNPGPVDARGIWFVHHRPG